MTKLKVTQKRSSIGRTPAQRRTIRALGLRRIGHSVVHDDNPTIRGMVFTISHLVEVTEVPQRSEAEPPEVPQRSEAEPPEED